MENDIKIFNIDYGLASLGRLNKLRQRKVHCDFTIKIGAEEIPAHKIVLSANSDYFQAMLSHDTLENQSGMVEIRETDPEAVKICIEFIYTGRATFTHQSAEKVFQVAKLLLLEDFSDGIMDYYKDNLSPKSFYETKTLAAKYSCKELEEVCDDYVEENFEEITDDESFVEFHQDCLFYIMERKETKASESKKLYAVIKWIKHDPENRKQLLHKLLGNLDLAKIPLSHRRHVVENDPLITDSLECLRRFTISILDSGNIKPRTLEDDQPKEVLLLFKKSEPYLHVYEPTSDNWNPIRKMKKAMLGQNFRAVPLGNMIFVFMQNQSVYRLKFHEVNSKWKRIESMKQRHGAQPPAVIKNGFIFVMGGSNHYTNNSERYDPLTSSWTNIANTNLVCFGSTVTAVHDAIYKTGGWIKHGEVTNMVEKYDLTTNRWCYVAPMKQAKYNACSVGFNKKVYVLGGFGPRGVKTGDIQVYDPLQDMWETINDFTIPSTMLSVCISNGEVFGVAKDIKLFVVKLDLEEKKCESVCDVGELSVYGNLLAIKEKL